MEYHFEIIVSMGDKAIRWKKFFAYKPPVICLFSLC